MDEYDLGGRRLHRERYTDRLTDPMTGYVFCNESMREVSQSADGATQTVHRKSTTLLSCGHPGRPAGYCVVCSKKLKRTAYLCHRCKVECETCGKKLCKEHSRPAADNKRYCRKCLRRLPRELRGNHPGFGDGGPFGWLSRLLEWW